MIAPPAGLSMLDIIEAVVRFVVDRVTIPLPLWALLSRNNGESDSTDETDNGDDDLEGGIAVVDWGAHSSWDDSRQRRR